MNSIAMDVELSNGGGTAREGRNDETARDRRKGWGSWRGRRRGSMQEATELGQGFLKGGVLGWMGTELPFIGRRLPLGSRSRSDGRCRQAGFIARLHWAAACAARQLTTEERPCESVRVIAGTSSM